MNQEPEANIQRLWSRIKQIYKEQRTLHRYKFLELSMFSRKSGAVKLRGKGIEIKGILPILLQLWQEHLN